ncbi:MAG: phytanoyl-CoA dioxygenase family protein [Flavobacteriaceae bacterium]
MNCFEAYTGSISHASVKKEIANNGFFVVDRPLPIDFCNNIIKFLDEFPEGSAEINYNGSEKRVYGSEKHCAEIASFKTFSDRLLSDVFERNVASSSTLAIRNLPLKSKKNAIKGRWHLDSFRRQIKVFLFLTDVSHSSGPLQLVKGSNKLQFKCANVAYGNVFSFKDLLWGKKTRLYQSITDDAVEKIAGRGERVKSLICEAGTVAIVDTSMLHRALPCESQPRYALTGYYDSF